MSSLNIAKRPWFAREVIHCRGEEKDRTALHGNKKKKSKINKVFKHDKLGLGIGTSVLQEKAQLPGSTFWIHWDRPI